MFEFKKWPKIPRWENEDYFITEKIDGTNACVVITDDGEIGAQSRSQIVTPKTDNFGFASWVEDNKHDLLTLGPGYHFGEWWGQGIQRNYGLKERRFSLFSWWMLNVPKCCSTVPLFDTRSIEVALEELKLAGSKLVEGWTKSEGLIITSRHYKGMYKIILDK